ncbi:hypothetical protein SAMN05443582_103386 [Phyllobacterium sp. OV277]|nr:hypothetical protein SAMN05443582_103386 [Phyllobacterium sp. OV277]
MTRKRTQIFSAIIYVIENTGRSERIRTSDPVVPNGQCYHETRVFAGIFITLDC